MSDPVRAQYEAFPYPERDPQDERRRLITGSPSWPQEMDHWLWGGARDWSRPLRVLVAGGGTGDGLIQIAALMAQARRPARITYVDLSAAARRVAEARAAARGLTGITFVTGSLLDAGDLGPFDYIDCCGVLHHLLDPQAGFGALAGALAPGGGIGLMVYAPHGRAGVYALQKAFASLCNGLSPEKKLATAKKVFPQVPEAHPFRRNVQVQDHEQGDAGFYDLLLHSTDRPFTVTQLAAALDAAGLEMAGTPQPALYDPARMLPDGVALPDLTELERMQLAEDLRGTFRTHVLYAVRKGARVAPPKGAPGDVPHLRGAPAAQLAKTVARRGEVSLTAGGSTHRLPVPKGAAPLIARVDGRHPLSALATAAELDPVAFAALWCPVEAALAPFGHLHYSRFLS